MTNRDLKKLRRSDLLELLAQLSRENERLRDELHQARKELANRALKMEKAGTLAEAVLAINGVLEATDAACAQYLESIRYTNDAQSIRRSPSAELSSKPVARSSVQAESVSPGDSSRTGRAPL